MPITIYHLLQNLLKSQEIAIKYCANHFQNVFLQLSEHNRKCKLSRGPAEIPTRESLQQSHGLLFPCTIYKISVLIIEIQIAVNLEKQEYFISVYACLVPE